MLWFIPNLVGKLTVWIYGRLRKRGRYVLPVSGQRFSGWKDYDRPILENGLILKDRTYYLQKRLELVFFNSLDHVYLKSAPRHYAVNGPDMSFFMLGTTAVCCCIEALGAFVLGATSKKKVPNKEKFKAFMGKYLPQWKADGVNLPDWMYENVRNSLAHGFWIKSGGMEDLGKERFQIKSPTEILIHAELLYKDLKAATVEYLDDVSTKKRLELVEPFENRFKDVYETF